MKTPISKISAVRLMLVGLILLSGCTRMSEEIRDKTAGMNGSFEIAKSGLPVNWLVFTPKTVPTGDFDIIIDTTEYKDGEQSLQFLVQECSTAGEWHSPGFCNEYEANPGEIFSISFWIKNNGTDYQIRIGGVSATAGKYDTIVRSKEPSETWQYYEYYYTIPEKMKAIRFVMNILQPGTFWIDDIKIEKVGS